MCYFLFMLEAISQNTLNFIKEMNENYFQEILYVIKVLNLQQMIFDCLFVCLFLRELAEEGLRPANRCDFDRTNTCTRNQVSYVLYN